ncbi:uncharacterized protein LOC136771986 [Amia ocellicauda]|uniref:uncharacterized protein LOC136771986 n=1 Tax=Amia ocellicauda TaxID=2972642 RepID=UPI0034646DEB
MVLFTRGDELAKTQRTIEAYIERWEDLRFLLKKCGNRLHVLDNKSGADLTQVTGLLEKIEEMVAENNGWPFTSERFQEVEAMIRVREEEKLKQRFEDRE